MALLYRSFTQTAQTNNHTQICRHTAKLRQEDSLQVEGRLSVFSSNLVDVQSLHDLMPLGHDVTGLRTTPPARTLCPKVSCFPAGPLAKVVGNKWQQYVQSSNETASCIPCSNMFVQKCSNTRHDKLEIQGILIIYVFYLCKQGPLFQMRGTGACKTVST